nr:DUF4145 domain-containing protein [Methylobacterium sp. Leaf122]
MAGSGSKVSKEPKIRRAICAVCAGERNCRIRGKHQISETYEYITGWTNWYLLQCRGCNYVFTQQVSANSEDWHFAGEPGDYDIIEHDETITYFPALSSRPRPEWMLEYGIDIPGDRKLDESLIELYKALDAGLNRFAAMGIRTCFDVASEELGIAEKLTFADKLGELVKQGHIGQLDKDQVNGLIEAGNASVHRGWKPNSEQLNTLMNVLEHFVYTAFVVPARREKLAKEMKKMSEEVPKKGGKKN